MGEMGEGSQKVQISSYEMSKSLGCNVSLVTVVMDVNWTYCGDHFAIYTNIES